MNDLHLFALLRAGAIEASTMKALLDDLAALPLEVRLPFFGVLKGAIEHEDASVAAAALRALRGADGPYALRRLVTALSDERTEVWQAAVEALRESCVGHPGRWVHAVFHPRDDVRIAAANGAQPPQTDDLMSVYLLADPACCEVVLRRMERSDRSPAGEDLRDGPIVAPAHTLPAILELAERGDISSDTARRLLAGVPWEDAIRWLKRARRRSEEAIEGLLNTVGAAEGPEVSLLDGAQDALDELFELFWDGDEETFAVTRAATRCHATFWGKLTASIPAWKQELARRIIASILRAFARKGSMPKTAAGVCAIFYPRFLTAAWVPRAVRYGAVTSLYVFGLHAPRLEDDEVKALFACDLCRRPSGSLDLWVLGGLLQLVKSHPYKRLLRWVKLDDVLAAFAEDPEHAAPILCLRDESRRGRDYLLARLDERLLAQGGLLRALIAITAPIDELDFLRSTADDEAALVTRELVRLVERSSTKISAKKTAALAQILGEKLARGRADVFLEAWLEAPAPEASALGLQTLGAIGVAMEVDRFVATAESLAPALLRRLLGVIPYCHGLPFGKELALARSLASHADADLRAWSAERLPPEDSLPVERAAVRTPNAAPLSSAEREAIAACSEADLASALTPCFRAPRSGIAGALEGRPTPSQPSIAACAALLGAHDGADEVDHEFARFSSLDAGFLAKLDSEVVRIWEREANLPMLGHAWLYRWERHALALMNALLEGPTELAEGLRRAAGLTSPILRDQVWEAAASVLAIWRWRRGEASITAVCSDDLLELLSSALRSDLGEPAAKALVAIVESNAATPRAEALKPRVIEALPDMADPVRRELARWVDSRGLARRLAPRTRASGASDEEAVRRVRASFNLDELEGHCASEIARIVEEAALRLLELGQGGVERILRAIRRAPPVPGIRLLIETVPMWPEGACLQEARSIAGGTVDAPPELRFRVSLALVERGERAHLASAIEAAREETTEAWFRLEDWAHVLASGAIEIELAAALAPSPHPHAYRRAVERLLDPPAGLDAVAASALRAFLEAGTERSADLRRRAAAHLRHVGDFIGFPILLEEAIQRSGDAQGALLSGAPPDLVRAAVVAVLTAGARAARESLAVRLLDAGGVDAQALGEACELLLADAQSDATRASVVKRIAKGPSRAAKLRRVAEAFAWGVRKGRELTGRVFTVRMIGGSALGYTRFDANHIFVTPLPLLRGEPHGRTIVEGLILHELGHHMYHRGDEAREAWDTAQKEGIFGLLNLVADEHLERNLRAVSAEYGDRLKRLAAYAFQHADKEIAVAELLAGLGGCAFQVLTATRVEVARRDEHVRVSSGPLLYAIERAGRSFPRFMRALRMGLGNRHNDPVVEVALAHFKSGHRRRSMKDLLELARKLRDLFGWQASLVESFGPHESLPSDSADEITHGEGITAEELEAEIERVLDPRGRLERPSEESSGGGRPWINVSPDERFTTITTVVKVPFDPAAYARGAAEIARHARQMRRYLEELGLSFIPERRRLSGGRFDVTRTLAVVLRGDPRMLITRRRQQTTDLYLGVLIDCSGSMQSHGNMEKAKLFGTMLAEAARGMRGVDLDLFGFTGDVIYDAGDADRCAVHSLVADGGNNDAAALWHAANAARASLRRAKLLVMVSDGLPTECSAGALRALASRISNRAGIACAQIAVQPLAEVCFPHYVVVNEANTDDAVRRFGTIVAALVRRTLAGA